MDITQIDSQTLKWSTFQWRALYPITRFEVIGRRIVIYYAPPDSSREFFHAMPLDPEDKEPWNGRLPYVEGDIYRGTEIHLLNGDLNGFVVPSGATARAIGQIRMLCEITEGFAVLVNFRDSPRDNVMLYDRDGKLKWVIAFNDLDPPCSIYTHIFIDEDKLFAGNEAGRVKFEIDGETGKIIAKSHWGIR